MSVRRRLTTVTGAVLLTSAVVGCSSGRTMVGTLSYETEREVVVTVTSPSVNGCHRLLAPRGVTRVENNTLVDIRLFPTPNCTGQHNIYLATNTSNQVAPGALPWRSYSVIH
ncbi:hypothetical protein ACFY8C_00985 [Streptomyces flavochromogenes]|jgi:hypothetical protein|uniref:Uncharacterized protein n=1 Tax=Streptomyces flavochromogenes TaxID=68199 RepID=A0ABW6XHF3_9ACTN|nr:hypothetical protein [Streptomyces flavochromogenes]